jgi:hypothetical protein
MRCLKFIVFPGLLALSVCLGCGGPGPATTDADLDLMDELLGPEDEARETASTLHTPDQIDLAAEPAGIAARAVAHTAEPISGEKGKTAPVGEKLELHLLQGDRFPLVKTIEQTLIQKSDVAPAMARTKLELTLIITVEDVRADGWRLGVRYSRVLYQHDLNGQYLSFDSGNHQGQIPWDAIPYAGMVNNGFSFWLSRNNSIREVVGYREFLERCVANVPLDRRATLLSEISSRFGDDGVANFVDDTIGLLPYDNTVDQASATRVLPGDLWTRERRLMQPVPIHLKSTYRLLSLNERTAEIEITGRVATGEAGAPTDTGRLRIIGGQSMGHCTVDRATGLPLEMNLSRFIKMQLTTSDNQKVMQEKQIVTTIRSFPEMRGVTVGAPQQNSPIQPASATGPPSGAVQQIPTQSGSSRPVRALYPN